MVDEPLRRGRRPFAVLGAVALLTALAVAAPDAPVLPAWNADGPSRRSRPAPSIMIPRVSPGTGPS
ncbi:hypothetical protein, partial [Methylobacterium frigidaeris]|uniref:hypothetical protein n=1 Tax=Methylobacterium frigidaeris TaxID=2038277 RepID=UPI001A9C7643